VDISGHGPAALRALREAADLTQEELAFRAGLDRTYVSGIERNRRNPSLRSLQRLVQAMGISLDVLFVRARRIAEREVRAKRPRRRAS
jgi:transcriptional regulator with XRE-family HTH domain